MDQAIRNKLRSVVTQCRRLLEESVAQQLQGRYDIYAIGKKDEVRAEKDVPLEHLGDEERQARQDILAHFEHVTALGYKPREALEQLIREIAFTHLNRLCAYKMMEVRDVYVGGRRFREAVGKGLKSQGFLFYLADHPEDEQLSNAGRREEAYRHFLNWLGGTLSQEIGVLFSPTDPANRVYPPQRVLDEVLDLLNGEELKGIWSEDETIGWVYQYFTPKELRDQARKESQAPRNSYELAFRNQFFTPRYVVEFLTDNTLGRIWYEMRQGRTRLADDCRYMVRRPDEVFLARMTSPDEEYPQEACVEAARLLSEGDEASFPPFDESEESIRRMIAMAHVVSAYDRHGDEVFGWDLDGARHVERMGELSTQFILDLLFATCRADRQGGGWGNVYGEPWFVAMANEVRRRSLAARDSDLKTEERLRLPVFVPYRLKKDPREIKILDPACGSGHFLLYAFGLLLTIYQEAYDDPDLGPGLQADYPTKDDMLRAVPGLILRHNLHGIDIDLRCAQIAALALWLRCQRAYQEMLFKKDRPRITRSNIVCAEPMPGEEGLLDEFLKTLREDRLESLIRQVMNVPEGQRVRATKGMVESLSDLVRTVWDKMRLAGEAGSLLKIEEDLRDAIGKGQDEWEERLPLFRVTEYGLSEGPKERLVRLVPGDVEGEPVTFWDKAETLVRRSLDEFVSFASNGGRFQRQLFVEDAEQGLGFVDVCRRWFDVVLMNPPFGEPSKLSKGYVERAYRQSKNDVYAAFVERGLGSLIQGGMLGAITSRTGFFLTSLHEWREEIILGEANPTVFADLGYGVLDSATVETAAYCVQVGKKGGVTPFFRLFEQQDKHSSLLSSIQSFIVKLKDPGVYIVDVRSFAKLPGSPFAYWTPRDVFSIFEKCEPFESKNRHVRCGMGTLDDFRFLRLWWEVAPARVGCSREATYNGAKWIPFAKGGTASSFYAPVQLVVDYQSDGAELKAFVRDKVGSESRKVQAQSYYFRPGIMFGRRIRRFSPACFPAGCIFSDSSNTVFIAGDSHANLAAHLGLLNGSIIRDLLSLLVPLRKMEVGYLQRLPFGFGEPVDAPLMKNAADLAIACIKLRMQQLSFDETDHLYHVCATFSSIGGLRALAEHVRDELARLGQAIDDREARLNTLAAEFYGISEGILGERQSHSQSVHLAEVDDGEEEKDETEAGEHGPGDCEVVTDVLSVVLGCLVGRWDIRLAISPSRKFKAPDPYSQLPVCSQGMLQSDDGVPSQCPPADYPLRIDWDGILVDDPDHPDDVIRRVRDVLEVIWKDRAEAIEKEACEILGVADLRDYFRKPGAGGFWDDHIKRYSKSRRKAPIYWLLQSSKKNYALWIYYHRLDKDILFKALLNYVEPKIRKEEARLGELRSQKAALGPAAKGAKKLDKDIDRQEAFLSELRDFEDKLRRAANLHLDPDLNDGVVLNIAPLHELVPWKEAKSYWADLMDGKYEWSSIGKQLREKGLVSSQTP